MHPKTDKLFVNIDHVYSRGIAHFAKSKIYNCIYLVLTAGLDNVKGMDAGAIVPACAPNDLSNKRYFIQKTLLD